MTSTPARYSIILVVEKDEETRYGIERLLKASGYQVSTAKDEKGASFEAGLHRPHLILISPGLNPTHAVAIGTRVRERAGLDEKVPIVIFCCQNLDEGAEIEIGNNVYLTRPDNFDQLRTLLSRLLREPPDPH